MRIVLQRPARLHVQQQHAPVTEELMTRSSPHTQPRPLHAPTFAERARICLVADHCRDRSRGGRRRRDHHLLSNEGFRHGDESSDAEGVRRRTRWTSRRTCAAPARTRTTRSPSPPRHAAASSARTACAPARPARSGTPTTPCDSYDGVLGPVTAMDTIAGGPHRHRIHKEARQPDERGSGKCRSR
jgi:hypothetical protein